MKIFHSQANEAHALSLVLKVRVFETQKWPISFTDSIPDKPAFPSPEALRRYVFLTISSTSLTHLQDRNTSYKFTYDKCY